MRQPISSTLASYLRCLRKREPLATDARKARQKKRGGLPELDPFSSLLELRIGFSEELRLRDA